MGEWDEPGAGSLGSLSLEAEALALLEQCWGWSCRLAACHRTGRNPGRLCVCGTEECSGPALREEGEWALLPTELGLSSSIQKRTYFYIFATWLCCAAAHVLWLRSAEWKEHPNQGVLWVGTWHWVVLVRWIVVPMAGGESKKHLLIAREKVCTWLTSCKRRRGKI